MTIRELHQRAQQAMGQQQYQAAHEDLLRILQQDPTFADAYFLLAMIACAFDNHGKGIELINKALGFLPDNHPTRGEYLAQLAKSLVITNDHVSARQVADEAVALAPDSPLLLDTLGVIYSRIGLHGKAVPLFKQAVAIVQAKGTTKPDYYFNLGSACKFTGDFDGASQAFESVLALDPDYCKAHNAIASLGGISAEHNHLGRLTPLMETVASADDKLQLGHALAREYESLGHFDLAYSFLRRGKSAKLAELGYEFDQDKQVFDSLKALFSNSTQPFLPGHDSREPIFVVGMPRTGTTLVERILSGHSKVSTAGELQHFGLILKEMTRTTSNKVIDSETIEAASFLDFAALGKAYINSTRCLTGERQHFVDKMPLNVLYAGFIIKALPNAKIICLDRHPLDTCVSNFRQLFAVNYSYYNYAYDLNTTAKYYLQFRELMQFWQQQFPENFHVVNYEQLVNEPETQAKQLLTFCDLPWEPDCLGIENNPQPVATASAVQVRSPINNKSVGNWRKYDNQLDGAKSILGQAGVAF